METYTIIRLLQNNTVGMGEVAFAIPPNPPSAITITGGPIFAQSYINAYNTAFNQPVNSQRALYHYVEFTYGDVNSNFIPGTFGYDENIVVMESHLK